MEESTSDKTIPSSFYQPAVREACGRLVLRLFPCLFEYTYLCVPTYHVRNNYITYIVAMRPLSTSAGALCSYYE